MAGNFPPELEELMEVLRQLPGIGRRAAERLALALTEWEPADLREFGQLLSQLPETVGHCPKCGALAAAGQNCAICQRADRDDSLLCVVEDTPALLAIEKGGSYRGRYLVLGGRISPLDGEDGSNLNFDLLQHALESGTVKEVILALGADVEGRATAAFVAETLQPFAVTITRPAFGLPAGATLGTTDGATVAAAINGRVPLH